ncbi:DUF6471 domain-containing protein [uncultured Sphingomonas sp.]|uniref:DUF6471 domain-containing protein n=1 Tax=uncultured Sphingomonas sp. TaxID=158754 RepID=UPI0035CA6A0C
MAALDEARLQLQPGRVLRVLLGIGDALLQVAQIAQVAHRLARLLAEQALDVLMQRFKIGIGVRETIYTLRTKLTRGRFTAVFLLQVMEALSATTIDLDETLVDLAS